MKVTYTKKGDYLLPDLYLEKGENYCENYYKELMENYIKNDERLSEKTKN